MLQDDVQTGTELASGVRRVTSIADDVAIFFMSTARMEDRAHPRTHNKNCNGSNFLIRTHKHQIDAITMAAPRLGCFPHSRFSRRNLHPWPGDANVASALMEI